MLKATKTEETEQYVSFKVEGIINNTSSPCVKKIWKEYINKKGKTVFLDFSGVSFINSNGLKMIKKIKKEKLVITNCSPFVRELLEIKTNQRQLK